jgi:hypothetical protein
MIGHALGHYRIETKLGEGGIGWSTGSSIRISTGRYQNPAR